MEGFIMCTIENAYENVMRHTRSRFACYDVVSDCIDPRSGEKLINPEDECYARFTAFRNNEIDYDADTSLEACVIYKKVFGNIINRLDEKEIRLQPDPENRYNRYGLKYELGEPDCTGGLSFRGDTMNSVATTNRVYFWEHKELHNERKMEGFPWPKEALDLIELYHTPGNFMVLPYREGLSINAARGTGNTHDYFDLYLLAIYNFFLEQNGQEKEGKISLGYVLGHNTKLELFMKYYLLPFIEDDQCRFYTSGRQFMDDIEDCNDLISNVVPGWESFVEENLFHDFVGRNAYGHFGKPNELWDGHFARPDAGYGKPYTEEQFMQFYTRAAEAIKKRSDRIYDRLHGVV